MKPGLSPQIQQSLHLTPQLLQSIRLLQLDGMQLEQEIRRALEHNPLLELEEASCDHADTPEVQAVDDWPDAGAWDRPASIGEGRSDDDPLHRLAAPESNDLHLRILAALALELPPGQWQVAVFWLEHCDEAGYLDTCRADLLKLACARFDLPAGDIEAVRQRLLHGDPAGMAACDLRECLNAQLSALPGHVPGRHLARKIVESALDLLADHDYPALAARVKAEELDVRRAARLIQSLQPRPGESALEQTACVIPDVMVRCIDGQWQVALNPRCTPRVCVNPLHEKALSGGGHEASTAPLRELLQQARGLAHGLRVRHDTLLRTAREIVAHQSAWLSRGDEAMAPLTLKTIAERLGVHESTISRITTGKYMQTPRGTFELKHFFAVRLDGAEVSGAAVRAMIRRLIDGEPAQRPLADEAIAVLLARQNIHIARRTVAKYREQLGIATARVRRRSAGTPLRARAL